MVAEEAPTGGTRWGSVRVRTTLAALAVVAVVLLASAVAFVVVLEDQLVGQVREGATTRADEIARQVQAGDGDAALATVTSDDRLVQLVRDDRVLASSGFADGLGPLADLEPGESRRTLLPVEEDDEEAFEVVATAARDADGPLTVLVADGVDDAEETVGLARNLLAVGLPLLLVCLGFVVWRVVGRALSPVEAIRTEVESIRAGELHRRVPSVGGNDEIARLADTMNAMLARLEAAQTRQRRFVADASHELRSPLASIRQHAEVAAAHPDRVPVRDLADNVLADELRLQGLVDDLLLLSRLDEVDLAVGRTEVDLDDLVLDEARGRRAGDHRVDTTAVGGARVLGDERMLRRVVSNLVDNAVRHATATVWVGVRSDDGRVTLTVEDDGPGIPPDARSRVLERFVRLDDARDRDAGGSGLGLAIVDELVTAHRGRVEIGEREGGGARITVTLPSPVD